MFPNGFEAQSGLMDGQALPPAPTDEWQRIEQAYQEIQRRDGSAERHAWQWQVLALTVLGLFAATLGVVLWQFVHHQDVQAFVQVVQVDEKGQVIQVGIPHDLLAYTPPDGLWMDMLTQWVIRLRWRGEDTKALARREWAWLYRYTCGQARRLLQDLEDREKPFAPGKLLRTVEMKSVTKTPVPESYQVLWTETSTEQAQPAVKTQLWTGTFSVGRYRPPTLADTLSNRLGLCVTAFDLSQQPPP
jgi:type IV secretory pathway TrbF-like protein